MYVAIAVDTSTDSRETFNVEKIGSHESLASVRQMVADYVDKHDGEDFEWIDDTTAVAVFVDYPTTLSIIEV